VRFTQWHLSRRHGSARLGARSDDPFQGGLFFEAVEDAVEELGAVGLATLRGVVALPGEGWVGVPRLDKAGLPICEPNTLGPKASSDRPTDSIRPKKWA
jgi:hypothetical protein